jgi:MFS family permease
VAVLYLCVHSLPKAWRTLNTDFPNYYMAAWLVHEGYDTSRMYEWTWIEREKDHRGVDDRVIGLLPITPFSTLAVWPIAEMNPLKAKHVWMVFNLLLLIPMAWMLRRMTGLNYARIVLVMALSFPLHRNLLFGQFYVLLLLMIVAACWCWLRGWQIAAGVLVAVAAGCKVFPALLLLWFLRRRQWRALASGLIAGAACVGISVAVFGVAANRTWLQEILPWVMRGEGLGTYVTGTTSISGVLHGLLLGEPQWNPHPWHESVMAYALLVPLLQMLVLAPAVLLIRGADERRERVLMEWSALTTAALAVSTIPASYNFVLMVFPVCVMAGMLLRRRQYGWLAALAIAYLGIGYPLAVPASVSGLAVLLWVPRLWLMMALLTAIYVWLWRDETAHEVRDRTGIWTEHWERYAWAAAMAAVVIVSTITTLRVERDERTEYAFRLPLKQQGFLNGEPQATGTGVRYTAFGFNGYELVTQNADGVVVDPPADASEDDLSFANRGGHVFVEEAGSGGSQIVDMSAASRVVATNAREPMVSADGKELAFLRDERGRGRLIVRGVGAGGAEETLTPPELNVYEAAFRSEELYAFAAAQGVEWPKIYIVDRARGRSMVTIADARYPAISPDGRWLAYSRMENGMWNLWLIDLETGAARRIADVPCNQVQPSWESDSKTLLYGTDCGRSVWFTAVARRSVLP